MHFFKLILMPAVQAILEDEYDLVLEGALKKLGHVTQRLPPGVHLSGVQAIKRLSNGIIEGKYLIVYPLKYIF